MDGKRFEATMVKFFEKAGVVLLKKGDQFQGNDSFVNYILLDTKRKSFYLAEADINEIISADMEFDAIAAMTAEKSAVTKDTASAILRIGRATLNYDDSFDIDATDLATLTRKSALIISEESATATQDFLTNNDIKFQTVPFKGAFSVFFIDNSNSAKLGDIYKRESNALLESSIQNREAESNKRILEEIAGMEEENKTTFLEPPFMNSEAKPEPKIEEDDSNVDEMLDNIDLSFISAPKEPEQTQDENDLLYSKILNQQADNHNSGNSPAPKARNMNDDIPEDVRMSLIENDDSGDEAAVQEITPKWLTDSAEDATEIKKEKTDKKEKNKKFSFTPQVIAANISGFIFFTPAYILGKALSKLLPAFVIYWLASIAAIVGLYQAGWSILSKFIYPQTMTYSKDAAAYIIKLSDTAVSNLAPLADAINSVILSASIIFMTQIAALEGLEQGWILRYLLSFAAILMIFPVSRKFGSRLSIFAVLLYFAAPLIVFAESLAISSLIEYATVSMTAPAPESIIASSALAGGSIFAVAIMPIIMVMFLYIFAGCLLPDSQKYKGVLP